MVISNPRVKFKDTVYQVVFTFHAKKQMSLRRLSEREVLIIIETGKVKEKKTAGKYWVYGPLESHGNRVISVALSLENPHLIVITTLVNWGPK